eukprot:6209504-Pleurochrysis_carterae.AAC.3
MLSLNYRAHPVQHAPPWPGSRVTAKAVPPSPRCGLIQLTHHYWNVELELWIEDHPSPRSPEQHSRTSHAIIYSELRFTAINKVELQLGIHYMIRV